MGPALQLGGDLGELGVDRTVDAAGSAGRVWGLHVLSACKPNTKAISNKIQELFKKNLKQ